MTRRWWMVGFSGVCSVLALALLLAASGERPATGAAPLRVCPSGCAYDTVQDAVDAAQPGDTVEVATGVYTGVVQRAGLWQMAYVTKSLTLRGGYSPDFATWDPASYTTTLDAQGAGRVVYAKGAISLTLEGLQMLNGKHASAGGGVCAEGVDLQVLTSTIAGCRLSPSSSGDYGVGICVSGGALTMENTVVRDNAPIAGGDNSHLGGGLYASDARVDIRSSQFLSNTAAYGDVVWDVGSGGGVYLEDCNATIEAVAFRGNFATPENGGGGGLWTRSGSLHLVDSAFEGNTNGGAALHTAGSLISGNVFSGNTGNGLYISAWVQQVINISVTHNLLENNTQLGLTVPAAAISMVVDSNDFINNGKGGLKLWAKSDTGAATPVVVRNNLFRGNSTTGNGGGAYLVGAVDVLFNRFVANHADGKGGGVYQEEYCSSSLSYSCKDNAIAVYDGNLFQGNSAGDGGGLYTVPKYSEHLDISYRNMAFLDNTATNTGSALYFYRYENTPVAFEHLTVANNTGGDGAMIYQMMGNAYFTNTILYSGTIGIKMYRPNVTLDHVLRYDVLTPTATASSWGLTDLSPITATPAFAADGYHLTAASAAVDAGVGAGVTLDIDGQPRPMGTAPDLGADESPYSLSLTGVQASKVAGEPQWKVYYTGLNVPPSTYLEQPYLIPFAYNAASTAPAVTAYALEDFFPTALDLVGVSTPSGLSYVREDHTLRWTGQSPMLPGEWGWVEMTGRSQSVTGGQVITNVGQMTYTLANGNGATLPFSATTEVPQRPVFPPLLITPQDGEICIDDDNRLLAMGVAGAAMVVRIYEEDNLKSQTTADASGLFTVTWTTALTLTHPSITVHAVACEPGGGGVCSAPSDVVSLSYPQADWCPQRSYWEGDVHGIHHTFYFRDERGRFASNDFYLPGVYGFWDTQVHLYSCCPHDTTNPFRLKVDGVVYDDPVAHSGRYWTFDIGSAHDVIVESQCDGLGGSGQLKTVRGEVLIDPDGFVFDVDAGGRYDALTGTFSPVVAVPGITVTAYVSMPEWGGWIPWPAHLYNGQVNPQVTGDDGYFAFFTPPGFYYLEAEGVSGYQAWRSPVVEVVNEIVHVNVPLTSLAGAPAVLVTLTESGPDPLTATVVAGGSVRWAPDITALTAEALTRRLENPDLHPLSARNPLSDTTGFDGGMLVPGREYMRRFSVPGTYTYSDGLGHTGVVAVIARVYVPLVLRQR